ncbi:MAG: serine hydrolase domain-containing protein, partial [Bryobacteraceae bacterium]
MKLLVPALLAASAIAFAQIQPRQQLSSKVDPIVEQAVRAGLVPGAVLVVGHNGRIIYRKAYGWRVPLRERMTLDTIFDAASLTKVLATTPSIMKLFQEGKIRLDDPVTQYLPEFQGGHGAI